MICCSYGQVIVYSYTGFYLKWLEPIVNSGVSCQRQQRGKMTATQPKWRQFCVEDGGLLEIVFFCDQIYFCRLSVSDWFWLRIDVYALGDLTGHCYVHFAFVFTLMSWPAIWSLITAPLYSWADIHVSIIMFDGGNYMHVNTPLNRMMTVTYFLITGRAWVKESLCWLWVMCHAERFTWHCVEKNTATVIVLTNLSQFLSKCMTFTGCFAWELWGGI